MGLRVQGSGFRVESSGFRVQGAGFRVQGSGFRVQGIPVLSGDDAVGVEHGDHFEEEVVAQHPRTCRMSWRREVT